MSTAMPSAPTPTRRGSSVCFVAWRWYWDARLKRQPPWPDRHRATSKCPASSAERLKRLFLCDVRTDVDATTVRDRDGADDGGSACGSVTRPARVSRRRSGRAAARHACAIRTWPRRWPVGAVRSSSPAGRPGKAARLPVRRKSASGCSRDALAAGAEYVDVEARAGFDDLIDEHRRTADRPVVARFRRRAGGPRRADSGDEGDRGGDREGGGRRPVGWPTASRCSTSSRHARGRRR